MGGQTTMPCDKTSLKRLVFVLCFIYDLKQLEIRERKASVAEGRHCSEDTVILCGSYYLADKVMIVFLPLPSNLLYRLQRP